MKKFVQQHQDITDGVSFYPIQRQESWGYIGAAAITVVGGAISSNNNKPGAPVYQKPLSLADTSKEAIAVNKANQGSIESLLAQGNAFNQSQATSLAEQAMPGFSKLQGALTNQATKLATNPYDVPDEVTQNLSRIAAEKGVSAGTRGQFNDFSLLRDLGVNQLQYGQSNLSQASSLTSLLSSISPKVSPMSPLSFYVTPNNAADIANGNATNAQAVQQASNNANAAASNQANTNMWNNFSQLAGLGIGALSSKNGSTGSFKGGGGTGEF